MRNDEEGSVTRRSVGITMLVAVAVALALLGRACSTAEAPIDGTEHPAQTTAVESDVAPEIDARQRRARRRSEISGATAPDGDSAPSAPGAAAPPESPTALNVTVTRNGQPLEGVQVVLGFPFLSMGKPGPWDGQRHDCQVYARGPLDADVWFGRSPDWWTSGPLQPGTTTTDEKGFVSVPVLPD